MASPTADVSVRVAWADDAPAIAEVQLRAWPELYGGLVPAEAIPSGPEAVEQAAAAWRASLASAGRRPQPGARRSGAQPGRGLRDHRPGRATPTATRSRDGELQELTVDPGDRGHGHGSRLLQAAADTMVADRFTRAVTWVLAADDALRAFLTDAGWAPDTAHRELDLDGSGTTLVKQVRLHTALS